MLFFAFLVIFVTIAVWGSYTIGYENGNNAGYELGFNDGENISSIKGDN